VSKSSTGRFSGLPSFAVRNKTIGLFLVCRRGEIAPGSRPVIYAEPVTRQEIEKKMDELAREYHDTHDPEIPEEIYRLARQLKELDH